MPREVKIANFLAQLKGKIHFKCSYHIRTLLNGPSLATTRLVMACYVVKRSAFGGSLMRISAKSVVKSSHDLILIVGEVIAVTMIVAKMVHNWRTLPPSLGMSNAAVMVADNNLAPR